MNLNTVTIILVGFFGLRFELTRAAQPVLLTDSSVVRFATVEKGRELIEENDIFITRIGPLERQIRLQSENPVSREQHVKHCRQQVVAWTAEEVKKIAKLVRNFAVKSKSYDLPFPKRIHFVKTTGKEEGGAAYCRKATIFFSQRTVNYPDERFDSLLSHELFHILSNDNRELRDALYEIIGFKSCKRFEFPSEFVNRRITNPDAPVLEHYINLKQSENLSIQAIPILYSSKTKYEGGDLFDYLEFKLIQVDVVDNKPKVVTKNGQPVLLDPQQAPDYFRQIGKNTKYVIHPEEVLADNFKFLMDDRKNLPNPEIVAAIKEYFLARSKSAK